eukprot:jgi/Ulvmu1/3347/UM156_0004.1
MAGAQAVRTRATVEKFLHATDPVPLPWLRNGVSPVRSGVTVQIGTRWLKIDGWRRLGKEKDANLRDDVALLVRGGKGGSGCSSIFRPKPHKIVADGGDGGAGGNVIIQADSRLDRLPSKTKRLTAGSGAAGSSHTTQGARGTDTVLKVPPGTAVWLLDKVFARVPVFKDQYRSSISPDQHNCDATLGKIDTTVSRDYLAMATRFNSFRQVQSAAGLRSDRAMRLPSLAALCAPRDVQSLRR